MKAYLILTVSAILLSCCEAVDYKEAFFDQIIDHFNFESFGSQTYKQRYIYNDTWWDKGVGPIFFYAGNEGSIEGFWENSGFILEIAPIHKALVLFAEHRYYGRSLPFGESSFENATIGWLSIEQALADYAFFLKAFKKSFGAENCPVIAFGGSYGGMLAAYMRFKFPNIIQGAIAASAPIYMVAGKVSGDIFFQAVTKDFRDASPNCETKVRDAFNQLDKWATSGQTGLDRISQTFRLCKLLKNSADYDHLLRWIRNAFVIAAMMDYPYPTNFIGKFPAFPVKAMCEKLESESVSASGLRSACDVYYNASGDSTCFDIYSEYLYCADPTGCGLGPDSKAWDYQACTEINLEANTNGVSDMFPVLPFNSTMRDEYCLKTWTVRPRRNWLDVLLWGEDISSTSNIVFSNGNLDPWAPGGVLTNISDSLVSYLVEGGAHHLDLRASHAGDPQSVIDARNFEVANIQKWLQEFYSRGNK